MMITFIIGQLCQRSGLLFLQRVRTISINLALKALFMHKLSVLLKGDIASSLIEVFSSFYYRDVLFRQSFGWLQIHKH